MAVQIEKMTLRSCPRIGFSIKNIAIILLVVVGLTAELTVRANVPDSFLPKGKYYNREFRKQVSQFEILENVDLLITGSSLAAVNIVPTVLDRALKKAGISDFTTFNAGIRGCNFICIEDAVSRHYLSLKGAENVLVVISPEDLDTQNPTVMKRSQEFVENDLNASFLSHIEHFLGTISRFYGYKGEIWYFLRTGDWPFDLYRVRERGYVDMGSSPLEMNDPVPMVSMHSDVTKAFRRYINLLSSSKANVILVPVEGNSTARKNFDSSSRLVMNKILDQASRAKNVSVLMPEMIISDNDYLDALHLKSSGARKNTRLLASQLTEKGMLH